MSPNGRLLSFVAGLLVGLSAFFPWLTQSVAASTAGGLSPADISSQWAVGLGGDRASATWLGSMLAPLILAAVMMLLGAMIRSSVVEVIAGIGVVALVILWDIQENSNIGTGTNGLSRVSDFTLNGSLGPGPVLALVGAIIALICGLVLRQKDNQIVTMEV